MHEVAIARNLLAAACEEGARAEAQRITRVECRIGAMRMIEDGLLQDAWMMCRTGTLCDSARLKVTRCCARSTCAGCGCDFPVEEWNLICPLCGDDGVGLDGGDELEMTRIRVDLREEATIVPRPALQEPAKVR